MPGGLSSEEEEGSGQRSAGELGVGRRGCSPLQQCSATSLESRWSADGATPVQPSKSPLHLYHEGLSVSIGQEGRTDGSGGKDGGG